MSEFVVEEFSGRSICIKGIGKLFYQEGFPISLAISTLKRKGIEVSLFHVADECLKHGWSAQTTINKLSSDTGIEEDGFLNVADIERFCLSTYEKQREMILKFLYPDENYCLPNILKSNG